MVQSTEPMKRDEALEFLLRLAGTGDPAELPEWKLLRIIDDLGRFLAVTGEGRVATQLADARNKPDTLKPVIEVVRQLAEATADHKRQEITLREMVVALDGTRIGKDRYPVFSDGPLRDVTADVALAEFGWVEGWEIRRCKWPECKKLFLAGRKGQIYCSRQCAGDASSDSYQKRKAKASRRTEKRGDRLPKKKAGKGGK